LGLRNSDGMCAEEVAKSISPRGVLVTQTVSLRTR
jgi:hypothetical protein